MNNLKNKYLLNNEIKYVPKSQYTTKLILFNIINLYIRICDELEYNGSYINKFDFPLAKEYTDLINNIFIRIYYKLTHENVNINKIISEYDLIETIAFGANKSLKIFKYMLLNDYDCYNMINHIYYFNKKSENDKSENEKSENEKSENEKSENDKLENENIIILTENQFIKLMIILQKYICKFLISKEYKISKICKEIEKENILSLKEINYY